MGQILNVVGAIVGFPLLWIGFVLATISQAFTDAACWLMGLEYDEDDGD